MVKNTFTFTAWDTVIRELQDRRDYLAAQRDSIGGIQDYGEYQRILRLIRDMQQTWTTEIGE